MEFIIWVETRLAGKTLAVKEVAKVAPAVQPEVAALAAYGGALNFVDGAFQFDAGLMQGLGGGDTRTR